MKDNLYLSRRKDDILIEYYFVCGYICFEKKKEEKKKHRPLSLSLSRLPSLTPALPPCCCVHFFLHGQRARPATTGPSPRAPPTTQGRAAAALLLLLRFFWRNKHQTATFSLLFSGEPLAVL